MQFFRTVLIDSRNILQALHALQLPFNGNARSTQLFQILTVKLDLHTGTSHHGRHIHISRSHDLTVIFLCQLIQLLCNDFAVVRLILIQDDIYHGGRHILRHSGHTHHACRIAGQHRTCRFHTVHFADLLNDLVCRIGSFFQSALLRHLDGSRDLRRRHGRHKGQTTHQRQAGRTHQQHHSSNQHDRLMTKRPAHCRPIFVHKTSRLAEDRKMRLLFQKSLGHSRNQRQCDQKTCQQRIRYRQCQIRENITRHPVHENDRNKHTDGRQSRSCDRSRNLHGPGNRSLHPAVSHGAQTIDIFHHHDGIVHQHPDPDSQTRQGNHIQCHAREVHQNDGKNHAERDADRSNKRRPQIPQEHQQDHDRQDRA